MCLNCANGCSLGGNRTVPALFNQIYENLVTLECGPKKCDSGVPLYRIPFYEEAARRRVRTTIGGALTWVHSAEVLAVFKMLFYRPKDLVDVERMLAVRGADLDRAFVRDALTEMLGEDERIAKRDEMCARVALA